MSCNFFFSEFSIILLNWKDKVIFANIKDDIQYQRNVFSTA